MATKSGEKNIMKNTDQAAVGMRNWQHLNRCKL
jgi:hypothetical protein